MKTQKYPILAVLAIFLTSCSSDPKAEDPAFDYNLKSAKVIETNNDFGLELLKNRICIRKISPM